MPPGGWLQYCSSLSCLCLRRRDWPWHVGQRRASLEHAPTFSFPSCFSLRTQSRVKVSRQIWRRSGVVATLAHWLLSGFTVRAKGLGGVLDVSVQGVVQQLVVVSFVTTADHVTHDPIESHRAPVELQQEVRSCCGGNGLFRLHQVLFRAHRALIRSSAHNILLCERLFSLCSHAGDSRDPEDAAFPGCPFFPGEPDMSGTLGRNFFKFVLIWNPV